MRLAIVLLCLAAGLGTAAAQRGPGTAQPCEQSPYNFVFGTARVETAIYPRVGQPCQVTLVTGGLMELRRLSAETRPRNGRVAVGGRNHYLFIPNPGFRGRDRFVIRLDTERNGVRATTRIEVSVEMR